MIAITENNIEKLNFEVLTQTELNELRGGVEPPKSRDKDIFDFEEE
ncbi:hypothetical protein [uncultured Draconibacterium sp.]|nr:hypothetical protein [uncultured Draconibacterium sp.]